MAYVQAVANHVHTRLVPSTNAGSTTLGGSRRMSGQFGVSPFLWTRVYAAIWLMSL